MTTRTQVDWPGDYIGMTGSLPALALADAVSRMGEPSFLLCEGGRLALGFGLAAAVEARCRADVMADIRVLTAAGRVRWLENGKGAQPPGPWFGGFSFDLRAGSPEGWQGFPAGRWMLPELLLWSDASGCWLSAFRPASHSRRALQEDLWTAGDRLMSAPGDPRRVKPGRLRIRADREGFEEAVRRALTAIAEGRLTKVVLARAIEATREHGAFDPFAIAQALAQRAPQCTTFFLAGANGSTFLGASPETLCRVEGERVETEALAGTVERVPGEPTDAAAARVLGSDKDRREQQAVVEGILRALEPLTYGLEAEAQPRALALATLLHLRTGIRGRLRPGVGPADVISALHPTPAVGGWPRAQALGFLSEHDGLERGWYAGGVGWLGEGRACVNVAIRSALVDGRRARVFVGAGVVAGSTPEGEWAETEAKARPMLQAIEAADG